jgi:hypothetical protein
VFSMGVSKKQMTCVHSFQATNRKAVLKVEATSKGPKGKTVKLDVVATIFKCSKCGAQKEYPDSWQQGYSMTAIEKVIPI